MGGASSSKDESHDTEGDSRQESIGASLNDTLSVEDSPFQRETTDQVINHSTHILTPVEKQRSKSFFQRNFSQIEKGGLRSSLFTMFSGLLGAGLLSLPKVISIYGVTLGMLSLLLFGMISWYTYIILNQLIMASSRKTYANVCAYYLGKVAGPTHAANSEVHHSLHDIFHHVFWNPLRICL